MKPHSNFNVTKKSSHRSHELTESAKTAKRSHQTKLNSSIIKRHDTTKKPKVEKSKHVVEVVLKEDWEEKKKFNQNEIEKSKSPDFHIGSFLSKIYFSLFN